MKVLLPIDGSIYSDRAIEYICEHSSLRAKTDTVYLLNVQKKLPSELASKSAFRTKHTTLPFIILNSISMTKRLRPEQLVFLQSR